VKKVGLGALLIVLGLALCGAAQAEEKRCQGNRSRQGAVWLSIAHPGLGEYYLKGWGSWRKMPKSADDAFHCLTNDELSYPPD
jgi:hypothetical protein